MSAEVNKGHSSTRNYKFVVSLEVKLKWKMLALKKEVATVPYFPVISHVQAHPVAPPSYSDCTIDELQGAVQGFFLVPERSLLGGLLLLYRSVKHPALFLPVTALPL